MLRYSSAALSRNSVGVAIARPALQRVCAGFGRAADVLLVVSDCRRKRESRRASLCVFRCFWRRRTEAGLDSCSFDPILGAEEVVHLPV